MALINCPECGTEVSDKAPACPSCGAPIAKDREAEGSGVQSLATVQETSKKFKLQSLISVTMVIVGFIWVFASPPDAGSEASAIPGLLITIGLIWYLVNRFRIWWHHK